MKTKLVMKSFNTKVNVRRARCKQVLVILNNRLEMVALVREEIHPGVGEFDDGRLEFAVVRWHGWEVYVVLECVVFLREPPPEPLWMQEARAKVEQELASRFNQEVKGSVPAERPRARSAEPLTSRRAGKRAAKLTDPSVKTKKVK